MVETLVQFAEQYSINTDKRIYREDEQKFASTPVLFVFIGDKSSEALKEVYEEVNKKWDNSDGIMFLNVCHKQEFEKKNVFNYKIPDFNEDKKVLRKSIVDSFYNDEEKLIELNKVIMKIKNEILSTGEAFTSFERVNISVVTRADDAMNILVPEIILLLKAKLSQNFRIIMTDLYTLLVEKNEEKYQEADEAYTSALTVSFFKELENMQRDDFNFEECLEVFSNDRKLAVVNTNKAVFDLVYVLSDTNEKGIITSNSLKENYEIISFITLIKNRNLSVDVYYDMENQYYDNSRFKLNISNNMNILDNKDTLVLCTAGLSKVKRPNNAVAITVLNLLYEDILYKMKQCIINKNVEDMLKIFELDQSSIEILVNGIFKADKKVEDMNGIMTLTSNISASKAKSMTLREAEKILYADNSENFFKENFERVAYENLKNIKVKEDISKKVKAIGENSKYGFYGEYLWTSEQGLLNEIENQIFLLDKKIDESEQNIENLYESSINAPSLLKTIFSSKAILDGIKKQIIENIYLQKISILKLSVAQKILSTYHEGILKLNEKLKLKVEKLENIRVTLNQYTESVIKEQHEYIGQNIKEYYASIVKNIIAKLENSYGENYYNDEKFLGDIEKLLDSEEEAFIRRLSEIANKYILCEDVFTKAFEEELTERANISSEHWNNQVLTKEELFKKLYIILEENSKVKACIRNYDDIYIEKYFFGDYSSEFVRYAFNFDRETRNYKIGYVHEKRASGIEKLNLIGGFTVSDLYYVNNSKKYYEQCVENGYEFHKKM